MKASNKVVFNTGITYARAVFTSVISLYSIRLILNALGAEDFGLYNVIGGMVAMLAFLNAAMTTATQRFISFNLGKGEIEKVKMVFANSVILHFFIGLVLVIGIELVGVYLINNQLKIPPEKITVAIYILHFVVASTFVTVISVPFDAVINANENFLFLAVVNIINSLFKLAIAFSIFLFSDDRLFYYGLLTMVSAIVIRIIKRSYSKKKYKECNVNILKAYDYNEMKGIGAFAGWSLFGSLCSLARNQGVAVVLNLFYTTVVNAAYGIAHQVNSQIMFFSQTMMSAMRPQIMKSEGANDRERMIRLSLTANKFSFYLFTFFAIPLFFEMPFILKLWLKNVPEYTVEFCRSIILLTMMNQINMGLMTAVQAIGKVKVYQVVAGGIQLLTLPIGYIFLKLGYPPYSIILVSFILESISTVFRVFYFKYLTGYSAYKYFKNVLLNSFLSMIPVILVVYYVQNQFSNNWLNLILVCVCAMLTYVISIYFIGLGKNDKYMIKQLIKTLSNKIFRNSNK
jgi:O-antigen/teichoic acid export membrane protein